MLHPVLDDGIRVHPVSQARITGSATERTVHAALQRQIPKGWYAWHSLAVRTEDGDETEADFAIAAPGQGLLILEVKGGQIRVEDGLWFQNGRQMNRPLGQAFRSAKRLEQAGVRPPPWGAAVAFPDVAFGSSAASRMPDDVASRTISGHQLNYLGEALPDLMTRALAGAPVAAPASKQWFAALHGLWGERWVPRLHLGESA